MPEDGGTRAASLHGRRRELETLDRLVADVVAGRSRVLVLRGDPGVGKSALLDHLTDQMTGWQVVTTAGVESETEMSYSGLHRVCTPLLDHLDRLPGPQRDALATVFGLHSGPVPDRFLAALATLSLVAEAAEQQPLGCIVDDAQWLDRASTQILAFVARRLIAEHVGLVFGARMAPENDVLAEMPSLVIRGLSDADARTLLLSHLHGPMDAAVIDRIVAESRGNPLALLDLPRSWTTQRLAGGFGLPDDQRITSKIELSYVQRLGLLPADTQLLLLTAAAEPLGDPALLRRAAGTLGLVMAAAEPAVNAGLLRVGGHVEFAHPLIRSATYSAADIGNRRRVHRAIAEATDAQRDPDRRAWHHARAAVGPDEELADELERSAGRARARGGLAAVAAFLARATELTPDPSTRTRRAVDAAFANLQAGACDTVDRLLRLADEGPVDELQHARMDVVRAQSALVSRRGNEAVPLLAAAARRLDRLDPDLARATYLDAFSAAHCTARLGGGVAIGDLARAVRARTRPTEVEPTAEDLLLEAFTALSDDYAAAASVGRRALERLRTGAASMSDRLRLLWQGSVVALELWDDDAAYTLSERQLQTVRDAGALGELSLALSSFIPILVLCGDLPAAAALVEEARSVQQASAVTETAYGTLTYAAWRGHVRTTIELTEIKMREARTRGEGIGIAVGQYARAVLHNGSGQHEAALPAALEASADPHELVVHNWGLSELVEAAARTGRIDLAADAVERLSTRARASGTDWALGIDARARALLNTGDTAEAAFHEAIEHLARARVRAELGRAHLLYGEWLRQADRRFDARRELRAAHQMFTAMGLEGFAGRADRELRADGATPSTRTPDPRDALTPHEAQIARLAQEGMSNREIGLRLFISAKTVEWHLRKVFTKLSISSRRDLGRALSDRYGDDGNA